MQDHGGSQDIAETDDTTIIRIQRFAVARFDNEDALSVAGLNRICRVHNLAGDGGEKLARLLNVLYFFIETGRHLDIANLDRGMRDALVIIALEAIILDLGVAADAAAVIVARSKNLQVRHGKIWI